MTKLWSERDFDECCYPVSGVGRSTMVCATPCRGSYCTEHRAELDRDFQIKPRILRQQQTERRVARQRRVVVAAPVVVRVPTQTIMAEVAGSYGVTPTFLKNQRGSREYALARQEAAYRLKHEGKRSLAQIAAALGLKDHTSAMHAIRKYEAFLANLRAAA